MRKNKLSYSKLLNSSKEEAIEMFLSTYSIKKSDMDNFQEKISDKKLTNFDKASEAAHFIYKSAINDNLEKSEALAQITILNIAALVTDWNNPTINQRSLGNKIRRIHGEEANKSNVNSIALLRQDVLLNVSDDKTRLNVFNEEKNPDQLIFSKNDLLDGVKLPSEITTDLSYLLGIYRADGNIGRARKNEFHIQGRSDDEIFYKTVLEDKIEEIFGFVRKTSIIHSSKTSKTTPRIDINSRTHFSYLQDVLNFTNIYGEFNSIIDKLNDKQLIAYTMGMIAGAGNIHHKKTKYSEWHQIQFKDKYDKYRTELQEAFNELGIKYNTLESRFETYLNREETKKILTFENTPQILDNQIGLFTNNRHISYIKKNNLLED